MKNRQQPEGAPALHLQELEDERWTWRWVDESTGIELHSNETYGSRDAATESARKAYPDVPFAEVGEAGEG